MSPPAPRSPAPVRLLVRYLDHRWACPLAAFVGCAAVIAALLVEMRGGSGGSRAWLGWLVLGLFAFGSMSQFAAVGWRLFHRRWLPALGHALTFVGLLFATAFAFGTIFWSGFSMGDAEDNFAQGLVVPEGAATPEAASPGFDSSGSDPDAFQAALLAAAAAPASGDSTVDVDLDALATLARSHRDLLRRYLAASPAWRLHEEHGHVFATRRWKQGGRWQLTLHGYYSSFLGDASATSFQSRLTLGLDAEPWWRGDDGSTVLPPGAKTAKLKLGDDNNLRQSHCVIPLDGLTVEIFEQSGAPERRLTKASLAFLRAEFAALLARPTAESALRERLPPDAIERGPASLRIADSFQPGIYDAFIRLNPGQPGRIYLRAYEATKGTRLSESRLKAATNEWIGWSADPEEQFFSNTHFTIYEGDWGRPYAARLEVWFEPDDGAPERKLLERTFRIEGWQR